MTKRIFLRQIHCWYITFFGILSVLDLYDINIKQINIKQTNKQKIKNVGESGAEGQGGYSSCSEGTNDLLSGGFRIALGLPNV